MTVYWSPVLHPYYFWLFVLSVIERCILKVSHCDYGFAISPLLFLSIFMYFEIVLFSLEFFLIDLTFVMKCSSLSLLMRLTFETPLFGSGICHVSFLLVCLCIFYCDLWSCMLRCASVNIYGKFYCNQFDNLYLLIRVFAPFKCNYWYFGL